MPDPVSLHKPLEILEPRPWENTLGELRGLMKNVVANHGRIRTRVIELKERYYDGQMGDGATNWERWAVNHFAYSLSYLRALSSPHPLQIDKWEAKRLREELRAERLARADDKRRTIAAWDEWKQEEKHAQEEANKKEAKRLYQKELMRVRREASKKAAVAQRPYVIERLAEDYKALCRSDQKIFLGLIGAQPVRQPKRSRK
jgi:hypothetical protein